MSQQLANLKASVSAVLATPLTSPPPARELLPVASLQPIGPRQLPLAGQTAPDSSLDSRLCSWSPGSLESGLQDQLSGQEALIFLSEPPARFLPPLQQRGLPVLPGPGPEDRRKYK